MSQKAQNEITSKLTYGDPSCAVDLDIILTQTKRLILNLDEGLAKINTRTALQIVKICETLKLVRPYVYGLTKLVYMPQNYIGGEIKFLFARGGVDNMYVDSTVLSDTNLPEDINFKREEIPLIDRILTEPIVRHQCFSDAHYILFYNPTRVLSSDELISAYVESQKNIPMEKFDF